MDVFIVDEAIYRLRSNFSYTSLVTVPPIGQIELLYSPFGCLSWNSLWPEPGLAII